MRIFQNEHFDVCSNEDGALEIRSKETGVTALVTPLATGIQVHGAGKQAYLSHGRDTSFLIQDRLLMGMPPLLELR